MNILELKEEKLNLQNELTNKIGEAETRELADNENSRLIEIRSRIDEIDNEISAIEKENKQIEINNSNKNSKTMEKNYRLFDLVKAVANGQVNDEMREFVNGNKIDYRALVNVSTATQGQENVSEEKLGLEVAIRNASVLNRIGASWLGNCVGDVSIPKYTGSEVSWKA
ncbi:MAG: hypothetical protein J6U51_00355, partial [Bacteroidales bacterium]|nr:hypothetical protein [Bacteroidales bacterium]